MDPEQKDELNNVASSQVERAAKALEYVLGSAIESRFLQQMQGD